MSSPGVRANLALLERLRRVSTSAVGSIFPAPEPSDTISDEARGKLSWEEWLRWSTRQQSNQDKRLF